MVCIKNWKCLSPHSRPIRWTTTIWKFQEVGDALDVVVDANAVDGEWIRPKLWRRIQRLTRRGKRFDHHFGTPLRYRRLWLGCYQDEERQCVALSISILWPLIFINHHHLLSFSACAEGIFTYHVTYHGREAIQGFERRSCQ